jgi:hypothetical protein
LIFRRYRKELDQRSAEDGSADRLDEAVKAELRQNFLGGRVISAMCGSAPLSKQMHAFMESLLDVPVADVPVQTIVSPTATLATIARYIDGERDSASKRPTFASVHGRDATGARAADLKLDKFTDAGTLAAAERLPRRATPCTPSC